MGGYEGDGKLVDNGLLASTDRYVVDLGQLSLDQQGSHDYSFRNLPNGTYVLGFEIATPASSNALLDDKRVNTLVAVRLQKLGDGIVFQERSKLRDWTWSMGQPPVRMAFVYMRGSPGTRFTSDPGANYRLTVEVVEPNKPAFGGSIRLLLKSGGWK